VNGSNDIFKLTKIVSVVRDHENGYGGVEARMLRILCTYKNITCNRDRDHRSPLIRSAVDTIQHTITAEAFKTVISHFATYKLALPVQYVQNTKLQLTYGRRRKGGRCVLSDLPYT